MTVLSEVQRALDASGVEGWKRELAETLAAAMDDPESANASTAKELRVLMGELTEAVPAAKGDVSDDLAAKRAARRAAAGS